MKVYFAADHAGFDLKAQLMESVRALGYESQDCGAYELDPSDDYPAFILSAARALSKDVLDGIESRAIMIGASGQGEAIAANRVKGVRCALYYGPPARKQIDIQGMELDMLASTREHNNANALSLGARFLTPEEATDAVTSWLSLPFSGGARHERRIAMLDE